MRNKDKSEQQRNNDNGYNNYIFPTTEHCKKKLYFGSGMWISEESW